LAASYGLAAGVWFVVVSILGFGGVPLLPPVHADEARTMALGRHLSRECSACHRLDGVDNGIPSITGWPSEDFVATIDFYRTGARNNPAMVSVAQSLSDEEIAALAAYYAALPKGTRRRCCS
jgi:cytochrome c